MPPFLMNDAQDLPAAAGQRLQEREQTPHGIVKDDADQRPEFSQDHEQGEFFFRHPNRIFLYDSTIWNYIFLI